MTGAADIATVDREGIERYLADLAGRYKPATVSVRFRALQQLFAWLGDEEYIAHNPMARMRSPVVPDARP